MEFLRRIFQLKPKQQEKPEPTPKNVPGDFYVQCNSCISCGVTEDLAPDLIVLEDDGCYFKKQPVTPDEINRALDAMAASCVNSIRYGGKDPDILKKIQAIGLTP